MVEIGSEATLTAGDLIVEELGSSLFSTVPSGLQSNPKSPRIFFSDDQTGSNFNNTLTTTSTPSRVQRALSNQETSKPSSAKPELTGEYLQNKLMQLESFNNNSNMDRDDDSDDHTSVSNLTDPTIFNNAASPKAPNSVSTKQRPPTHAKVGSARSPKTLSTIVQSPQTTSQNTDKPMDVNSFSWDKSVSHQGNAALGRALDVKLMASSKTTDEDLIMIVDATGEEEACSFAQVHVVLDRCSSSSRFDGFRSRCKITGLEQCSQFIPSTQSRAI